MPPAKHSRNPSTDARAALGEQLRIARVAAGFTNQPALGKKIGTHETVIAKAETGDRVPTDLVYVPWMEACGITGRERELYNIILSLARVKEGGAARIYFASWIDAEATAHTLRFWQPIIFPGLLQTEGYARETFRVMGLDDDQIGEQVATRLKRQEVLNRPSPPSVVIVLDETVLYRLIGTSELMRQQIEHVIELSSRHEVMIHVLPRTVGANAGLGGPVSIATGTGTPEVILTGSLIEDQLTTDPAQVIKASATFNLVRADAASRVDSRALMTEALQTWNSK
jgi:Domain of unknown function (DUF5753)